MSGKRPMRLQKDEATHSLPSKTTETTTTTPRKRVTPMPWTSMLSTLKNSHLKNDKGVLTTTSVSNAENLDTDPLNAKTPSPINRNNLPLLLPKLKKSLTIFLKSKTQPLL